VQDVQLREDVVELMACPTPTDDLLEDGIELPVLGELR
jgi:hypothetical protein